MTDRMERPSRGMSPRVAALSLFALLSLSLPGWASAQWTTNGNTTYTNNSVAIGTAEANPTAVLDARRSDANDVMLRVWNMSETGGTATLRVSSSSNLGSRLQFSDHMFFVSTISAERTGGLRFRTGSNASSETALFDRMTISPAGNVGVGTSSPVARLDVDGTANVWSGGRYAVSQGHMAAGSLTVGNIGANFGGGIGWNANTAGLMLEAADNTEIAVHDYGTRVASFMYYEGGGANRLSIGRDMGFGGINTVSINGNVGVGTAAPGFKFDVQGGAVNASGGLCIAGDCKTSWSQVGGGGQWTTSGSNLLYNAGNVGIGTTSPGARLDVGAGSPPRGAFTDLLLGHGGNNAQLEFFGASRSAAIQLANEGLVFYVNLPTPANPLFLSNGGSVGIGTTSPSSRLHVAGDITVDGNINAKYQDVAEWVPSTQKLQAGTVVVLDPGQPNHVLASTAPYDTTVAGVISARPGLTLGEAGEGKALVATTGRVKVRVDATRGAIKVGDLLVTSEAPGVAMKSQPLDLGGVPIHRPGTLIGKALESLAGGTGEILVLLSLQ